MADEKTKEQVKAEMDAAAEAAKQELDGLDISYDNPIVLWIGRNYRAAGYKRLGRLLIALSKGQ